MDQDDSAWQVANKKVSSRKTRQRFEPMQKPPVVRTASSRPSPENPASTVHHASNPKPKKIAQLAQSENELAQTGTQVTRNVTEGPAASHQPASQISAAKIVVTRPAPPRTIIQKPHDLASKQPAQAKVTPNSMTKAFQMDDERLGISETKQSNDSASESAGDSSIASHSQQSKAGSSDFISKARYSCN